MKELSIEEKARRYDEAIERAKEFKNNPFAGYDGTDLISSLFPELAESKDEKIRKTILSHFKSFKQWVCGNGVSKEDCIAWLEKQGEQKPLFFDNRQRDPWEYIEEFKVRYGHYPKDADEIGVIVCEIVKKQCEQKDILEDAILDNNEDGLIAETIRAKQSKPVEWSEIEPIIQHLDNLGNTAMADILRSFEPQPKWKPNEAQLAELYYASNGVHYNRATLLSLLEQLKKLKE